MPQKQLHFNYLECASCHDLNAEIGAVFRIVEKDKPSGENTPIMGGLPVRRFRKEALPEHWTRTEMVGSRLRRSAHS
jgi:hypothetical protein